MPATVCQRCHRLGALCLEVPPVLLEDLDYHVLKTQLPGGPGAKEVGQEVPTAVPGPNQGPGGARLLAEGHIQLMAQHGHSQSSSPMVPDPDVSGAGLVLGRSVVSQGREPLCKFPQQYRAGDRGTLGHAGHVVLCNHAENLACPGA